MTNKSDTGISEIYRDGDKIEITVPSKKNWVVITSLTGWIGGWFMGEFYAIEQLLNEDTPIELIIFLTFWLMFWTLGGIVSILVFLWLIAGKEIISVNNGILKLSSKIFGLGPVKLYKISDIKLMTIVPGPDHEKLKNSRSKNTLKSGFIEFKYGIKTIRFGRALDQSEATILVEAFKQNRNFNHINFK